MNRQLDIDREIEHRQIEHDRPIDLGIEDTTPAPVEVECVALVRFKTTVKHWPRCRGEDMVLADQLFLASLSDEDTDAMTNARDAALRQALADGTGMTVETE